ncbi:hypothetical protein HaLaN_11427 [Haematococcus lacustris]|uniref:Uncharacterized protein n=1 Tax=Haematococcus lacustris TaxID=44745 RepID=A0A699Z8Q8_HAELA|nr:hypothetical protein HaLaN_11427 [Haematococcus lacustris]
MACNAPCLKSHAHQAAARQLLAALCQSWVGQLVLFDNAAAVPAADGWAGLAGGRVAVSSTTAVQPQAAAEGLDGQEQVSRDSHLRAALCSPCPWQHLARRWVAADQSLGSKPWLGLGGAAAGQQPVSGHLTSLGGRRLWHEGLAAAAGSRRPLTPSLAARYQRQLLALQLALGQRLSQLLQLEVPLAWDCCWADSLDPGLTWPAGCGPSEP